MAALDNSEAQRAQAVKDYKLVVEYKHLKQNAPGGIYVVPDVDDLRTWRGVAFVRRGMYARGVFRFRLELPAEYNDVDAWPRVVFESRVYSPLVDPETGELDVRGAYPSWDPGKHYVVTVLTFLKKIFYIKNGFEGCASPPNAAAARAYAEDAPEFLREVEACVRESQEALEAPGAKAAWTRSRTVNPRRASRGGQEHVSRTSVSEIGRDTAL